MERAEALQLVRERVAERFGVAADDVAEDAVLTELAPDSLDVVELLVDVEERAGVPLLERDPADVRALVDLVTAGAPGRV